MATITTIDAAPHTPSRTLLVKLRHEATRRTSFWRSLLEMELLGLLIGILPYFLSITVGPAFAEIASFAAYPAIALSAWRLKAGTGNLIWRGVRVLLWCSLYAPIGALITWGIIKQFPYHSSLYGIRPEAFQTALNELIASMVLLAYSLVLPTRGLITLWQAARQRLRWLLTFSYLLIGILTVSILPVFYALFLGLASLNSTPVIAAPSQTASRLAEALTPTVRQGVAPGELNALLEQVLAGRAQLPAAPDQANAEIRNFSNLVGVQRLTLLRADGTVLAGAGRAPFASGSTLPEQERATWRLTLDQAGSGGCVIARPADGPLSDTAACPITAADGIPLATLVVENGIDIRTQWGAALGRVLGIVLIGTSFSLLLALPIILPVLLLALGIGFVIARRIAKRLELLALASADIAAGHLDRRITVDRDDEIGRLSGDFNRMAAQLEAREQALEAEAARAEAALEANRRLVANVSHELRNPLATLRGYVEAIEQTHGDQLPAHDLSVIQGEIGRLTTLIDDLFTLARAEAQQLPLQIEPVDSRALIHALIARLAPLAQRNRQIEIIGTLPLSLPLVVTDPARLEQVLLNLIQNALRHTPPGGIIALEASAANDHVALTVADTGSGIEADQLALIFERFYRGDQSRARETGGAGLGLALARELMVAMGGTITAESVPGRGSRFMVRLPLAEASDYSKGQGSGSRV